MFFSFLFRIAGSMYFYKIFFGNDLWEIVRCFAVGFIFDSCVAALILAIVFLPVSLFRNGQKWLRPLMVITYFLILLFNISNLVHLAHFGVSFNYYSLKHIDAAVYKTIASKPQFYFMLFGFLFAFLLIRNFMAVRAKPAFSYVKTEFVAVLVFLFAASFLYLPFPFYYYCNISANGIVNELPKNGVYCYVSSFQSALQASDLIVDVKDLSPGQAVAEVAALYNNVTEIKDEKILRRVEPDSNFARYKRVILIMMESMGSNAFNDSVAPELNRLKNEGLYFSNCLATGPRTQMGFTTLLTGVSNVIGVNYYRRKGIYKVETLASYLTPLNYDTYYLHNGFLTYDDEDKLLKQGGFKHLTDANDIESYKQKNSWGVEDEALFLKSAELISKTSNRKALYVLQSMTNHEPFELPADFRASHKEMARWNKKLQTYFYADYMLGKFIKTMKERADYDSTLIIITGDHGEAYNDNEFSYNVFHVPLVMLGGSLRPAVINYDCSHADIPYTILSVCGYNKETIMLGENLLRLQPGRSVFSTNYNAELNVKRHDTLYRFSFEKQDEWLFKLDEHLMEKEQIKTAPVQQLMFKRQAFAHYKLVRDYLLSGKINR